MPAIHRLPEELRSLIVKQLIRLCHKSWENRSLTVNLRNLRLAIKAFACNLHLQRELFKAIDLVADEDHFTARDRRALWSLEPFVQRINFVPPLRDWRISLPQFMEWLPRVRDQSHVCPAAANSFEVALRAAYEQYKAKASRNVVSQTPRGWLKVVRTMSNARSYAFRFVDYARLGPDCQPDFPKCVLTSFLSVERRIKCNLVDAAKATERFFYYMVTLLKRAGVRPHRLLFGQAVIYNAGPLTAQMGLARLDLSELKHVTYHPEYARRKDSTEAVTSATLDLLKLVERCSSTLETVEACKSTSLLALAFNSQILPVSFPVLTSLVIDRANVSLSGLADWLPHVPCIRHITLTTNRGLYGQAAIRPLVAGLRACTWNHDVHISLPQLSLRVDLTSHFKSDWNRRPPRDLIKSAKGVPEAVLRRAHKKGKRWSTPENLIRLMIHAVGPWTKFEEAIKC